MKIVIIGSGFAGLSAGYKLCKQNDVVIFEKDEDLGGMSSSYRINDYDIEKYYHHIFRSDKELLKLINELGLRACLKIKLNPTNGIGLHAFEPKNGSI
ncbi:TPA: FAD-dependent oxidoreductase [Methanosarcina acetivorans]|nr:FAD-dependent oxidoreductase [Methanosarcina acetivorans]HIH92822.1 FAD-dependent oxidoreductase [Methanosarcina acetivorans]